MRRKIFIINKHMAAGVAGAALYASLFIDDLNTEFHSRSTFTNVEVRDFLNQYAASKHGEEVLEQTGALILVEATDWRRLTDDGVD